MAVATRISISMQRHAPAVDQLRGVLEGLSDQVEPTHITIGTSGRRRRWNQAAFDRAATDPDLGSLQIDCGPGWIRLSRSGLYDRLGIRALLPDWPRDLSWLDRLACLKQTSVIQVGNSDDVILQSEEFPSNYLVLGADLDGKRTYVDRVGIERIDVSNHPGRSSNGYTMTWWASASMWFGPGAFGVLDRAALTRFGDEVREIADGVYRVDLFDVTWPVEKIRERQRAFREHMRFDELEPADRERTVSSDPTIAISEDGTQATVYYDAPGEPTRKSRSISQRGFRVD